MEIWEKHSAQYETAKHYTCTYCLCCFTSAQCKKIREPCLPFYYTSCVLLWIIIIAVAFGEIALYTGNLGPGPVVHYIGKEISSYEETAYTLFHPNLGQHVVNHNIGMCFSPYDHICSASEQNYAQIFARHNYQQLSKILDSIHVTQSVFGRLCLKFHSKSMENRYQELLRHEKMRILLESLENLQKLEDVTDYIMNRLHPNGIREPFHISLLPDHTHRLDIGTSGQGSDMTQLKLNLDLAFEYMHGWNMNFSSHVFDSYYRIHRSLYTVTQYEYKDMQVSNLDSNLGNIIHLPLKQWLESQNISQITLPVTGLQRFQFELRNSPIQDWKNYLFVCIMRSILHQTRLLLSETNSICKSQYMHYFPLDTCRNFRTLVKDEHLVEEYVFLLRENVEEYVIRRNIFEFNSVILERITEELQKLTIYVNRCTTKMENETITEFENKFLNHTGQLPSYYSYLDMVLEMISHPEFQQRRNQDFDIYYRNLLESVMEWNAWFDPNIKSVFIPTGMLLIPNNQMKQNSVPYYLSLRTPGFHEMSHFVSWVAHGYQRSFWSEKYRNFVNMIADRYQSYSDALLEENLADNSGLCLSYKSWNTTSRSDNERRSFFIFFVRIFCQHEENSDAIGSESNHVTDHGSARQRANLTLKILWKEVAKLWNCTEGDDSEQNIKYPNSQICY